MLSFKFEETLAQCSKERAYPVFHSDQLYFYQLEDFNDFINFSL